MPETIFAPINGLEARTGMKNNINRWIDKLPLLKVGNAFKKIHCYIEVVITAFPSDVPVPEGNYEFVIPHIPESIEDSDLEKRMDFIRILTKKRDEIQELIDKFMPTENFLDDMNGEVPDEFRLKYGLKVPLRDRDETGRTHETRVDPAEKGLTFRKVQ